MNRPRFYALMLVACIAGYSWLVVASYIQDAHTWIPGNCLFKHLTGIPCPSCGSTRSILAFIHADILPALLLNPLGILLALLLVAVPFWMLHDLLSRKPTLWMAYTQAELYLKRKWIALPAILVIVVNWIWNIQKGY